MLCVFIVRGPGALVAFVLWFGLGARGRPVACVRVVAVPATGLGGEAIIGPPAKPPAPVLGCAGRHQGRHAFVHGVARPGPRPRPPAVARRPRPPPRKGISGCSRCILAPALFTFRPFRDANMRQFVQAGALFPNDVSLAKSARSFKIGASCPQLAIWDIMSKTVSTALKKKSPGGRVPPA